MNAGRRHALWWIASVVFVGATIYLSLEPGGTTPTPSGFDKVQHCLAYAALMTWFTGFVPRKRHWQLAIALIAMGGLLELLQAAMQLGRSAEWLDFAANGLGVGLGWLFATWLGGSWVRRLEAWVGR